VEELLERYELPGDTLEIELTESTVMNNPEQAIGSMHAVRALGVSIAIDDFGTGHSSLSYLKRLPIDTLKIDRAFVMEADRNEDDAVICSTIIGLGNSLRLNVVAEGIETAAQLAYLKRQGCGIGQGYYFARPLTLAELSEWLKGRSIKDCRSCGSSGRCEPAPELTFLA
jgi:EAL domain-containing protein (putative c-di-GMP-specific phosphodiesterase class I)